MIYFITPIEIKNTTTIGGNVDEKLITPLIKVAVETYIRSCIGAFFYNDLLNGFNTNTLSQDEEDLVNNYIAPCIAWRVAGDLVITTSLQVKNKGTMKQSGDYSQSADFSESGYLFGTMKKRAEVYETQLIEYLRENKDLFPAFTDPRNRSKIKCTNDGFGRFQGGISFI
jgi:hypothetical protein